MKMKMRRNHTEAYLRRLSASLVITVFIAYGAGCDEAITSPSMNKAVNDEQMLLAFQQSLLLYSGTMFVDIYSSKLIN